MLKLTLRASPTPAEIWRRSPACIACAPQQARGLKRPQGVVTRVKHPVRDVVHVRGQFRHLKVGSFLPANLPCHLQEQLSGDIPRAVEEV